MAIAKKLKSPRLRLGYEVEFYLPNHKRIGEVRKLLQAALPDYNVSIRPSSKRDAEAGMIFVRRDCSLEGNIGYEIVTPPLPVGKANDLLQKVFGFISLYGGYTSDDTGLHANLSLVKIENNALVTPDRLVLAVGNEDVKELKKWNRINNEYCQPTSYEFKRYLKRMIPNYRFLSLAVQQAVGNIDDKCISVNLNHYERDGSGYYEFRIMGNRNYHLKYLEVTKSVQKYAKLMVKAANMSQRQYEKAAKKVVAGN